MQREDLFLPPFIKHDFVLGLEDGHHEIAIFTRTVVTVLVVIKGNQFESINLLLVCLAHGMVGLLGLPPAIRRITTLQRCLQRLQVAHALTQLAFSRQGDILKAIK